MPSNPVAMDGQYDKWAVDNALSTIRQAEEYKSDPKMMKLIEPIALKQRKALDGVISGSSLRKHQQGKK